MPITDNYTGAQPPIANFPSFKERIAAARAKMEYIEKRGHNEKQDYNYAQAGDIQGYCGKILAEHGIIVAKRNETIEYLPVKTTMGHDEWWCRISLEYGLEDVYSDQVLWYPVHGEGRDNRDKGYYKASTGARKYFLIDALMLGIGDDPEASGDEERETKPASAKRGPVKIVPAAAPAKAAAQPPAPTISQEQAEEMSLLFRTHAELTHSTDLLERALVKWQIADLLEIRVPDFDPRMKWLQSAIEAKRVKIEASNNTQRMAGEE